MENSFPRRISPLRFKQSCIEIRACMIVNRFAILLGTKLDAYSEKEGLIIRVVFDLFTIIGKDRSSSFMSYEK